MNEDERKIIARNRKAEYQYNLEDRYEAGIALKGSEIKSIRDGQISIREAFVRVSQGQAWLVGAHIAPYKPASHNNHDPIRERRLLLKKSELRKLQAKVSQRGYTVVPTQVYVIRGMAKVEIALARGKRKYDKRKKIAERDAARKIARSLAEDIRR